MKFMMIVKASKESEAGVMPSMELITEMGKYNEQLQKAGVLRDLNGLQPTSKGARIQYSGGNKTVIDGPFAETKEVIGGYWIIEVPTLQDAIDWALRAPCPHPDGEGQIEIRPLFSLEDFGPDAPEAARAIDQHLKEMKQR